MHTRVLFPLLAMLAVLTTSSMAVMVVAVLAPEAAPEIGVDATRIGTYTAIVYLFATLSGAVTGILVNRYGAIRVCQGTMLFAAIAMLALSRASLGWALVSAIMLGFAYGPFNPASAQVLWHLSTPRWRPFTFSVKQTGVPLGGALAGALIPSLVLLSDWKTAALVVGAVALLMMVLLQPFRRSIDAHRGRPEALSLEHLVAPLRLVLGEPRLRRYTLAAFAYAGCQLSVATFMVVYLSRDLEMTLVTAGSVFAFVQMGGFAGRLLWGAAAARLAAPRVMLAVIGLFTASCVLGTAIMSSAWPLAAIFALATLLGANSFGWNGVMLSEVASHAPEGQAADATAGMQVIMFGGITIFPPAFGALVTYTESFTTAFVATAVLAVYGAAMVMRVPRV